MDFGVSLGRESADNAAMAAHGDKEYTDVLVLLSSGMTCFDKAEYDDAIDRYGVALQILEKWAGLSPIELGEQGGRKGEARALYHAILALRGDAYKEKGDYERAVADYGKSIALHATPVRSFMGRADLYERMGDRTRAIADFQKALELGPDMLPQYVKQCEG